MIYFWNIEDMKYEGSRPRQIDPLESANAGHIVYCGIPQNATEVVPPEEKEGFDIVWNGESWEYQEQNPVEPEPEPTELELAYQAYYEALQALAATDYKALKYVDGEYTDEEYEPYKQERAVLRQAVRDAEQHIKDLEGQ